MIMRFLLIAVVMVVGCSKSGSIFDLRDSEGYGSVSVYASAPGNSQFASVAKRAEIIVTASDMARASMSLSVSGNAIRGVMNSIPSGRGRLFELRIYDSIGVVKYQGRATSDVEVDQTVTVPITLVRASGNAVINGTIVEDSITTGFRYFKFTVNSVGSLGGGTYGVCLVEVHFMDGLVPVLSGYTVVSRDTLSAGTMSALWDGDHTTGGGGAGYVKPLRSPWSMVLDMGRPYTYTGLVLSCWETHFYGVPTSVAIYGAMASAGPWTQIGSKTWTVAYTTDTIPVFY